MSLASLKKELRKHVVPEKKAFFSRFFKTGPGEYGEGDKFLGVTVPSVRSVAKAHKDLSFAKCEKLLASSWHEERMTALVIWQMQFKRGDEATKEKIYKGLIKNFAGINGWDLIDMVGPHIGGPYLWANPTERKSLRKMIRSRDMWKRRFAIMCTFTFIREGDYSYTLDFCEHVLDDSEDLIHKASGWMLREVGRRDVKVLRAFLDQHVEQMPRTMLRYAIEKLSKDERKRWLSR